MNETNVTTSMEAPYEVAGFEAPDQGSGAADNGRGVDSSEHPEEQSLGGGEERESERQTYEGENEGTGHGAEEEAGTSREEADKYLSEKSLDMGSFEREFMATGALSEESYKKLMDAGIPREAVDSYIAGQSALAEKFTDEIYSLAGGQEEYQKVTEWAQSNLPQDEIDAFNNILATGQKPLIKIAASGVIASYREAEGSAPSLVSGRASSSTSSAVGFASAAEMTRAMSDPRYGKDSAYTREVERKTYNSSFFG